MAIKELPINADQDGIPQSFSKNFDQTGNSSGFIFDVTLSTAIAANGKMEAQAPVPKGPLSPLGVELNREKTRVVDTLKGEAFGFLGFDLRRVRKRKGNGFYIQMTPKKKARKSIKARVRDIIQHSGATPMPQVVKQINASLAGWANYLRVGNANRAFSEVRDYVEMRVRTLLTRRKRRRKTIVGWRRWSNEYLYGVLGLYWDWKVQPLPGVESMP